MDPRAHQDGDYRAGDAYGRAEARADASADASGVSADGDPVEHLWNAAHEMLRAFRTLIDAADEFVESQRGRSPVRETPGESREGRVHHIDIDDRPDAGSGSGVA
jgi:hypothetical protein